MIELVNVLFRGKVVARFKYVTCIILFLTPLTGCGFLSLGHPSLTSNDPALKIPAMKSAALHRDRSAIPDLIKALSSQDSAIRFYAIYALKLITGHAFGYIYYASDHRREIAIHRWRLWLAAQQADRARAPATKPQALSPTAMSRRGDDT